MDIDIFSWCANRKIRGYCRAVIILTLLIGVSHSFLSPLRSPVRLSTIEGFFYSDWPFVLIAAVVVSLVTLISYMVYEGEE
ncbi:hypothetical protein [Dongshaea marina]|uniref:hypothetical protein n=1 Tax=Dongshaea marina TaxID=2047966 RepID=UPI000D3E654C|nr:hypothetical protein [Dongshaea marina]